MSPTIPCFTPNFVSVFSYKSLFTIVQALVAMPLCFWSRYCLVWKILSPLLHLLKFYLSFKTQFRSNRFGDICHNPPARINCSLCTNLESLHFYYKVNRLRVSQQVKEKEGKSVLIIFTSSNFW